MHRERHQEHHAQRLGAVEQGRCRAGTDMRYATDRRSTSCPRASCVQVRSSLPASAANFIISSRTVSLISGPDPLWGELFPAEQARVVRSLVERVVVGPAGADIQLRVEGLAGLARDLTAVAPNALKAAA
jgi:hypothetical protein